ncbi:MAG: hypothetical protein CSA32_00420 [Desulfobulbus propionicus]|nr:MAG: hypothetical protein CSA32_00420 [Desulfobulbus propionicus]
MKQNVMRSSLLKGGITLLSFAILVYLITTSAHGQAWDAIGMFITGIAQLILWAIGMTIGITFCLAVLFGIFLGAVAMVNKESSAAMYQALKVKLVTFSKYLIDRYTCPCRDNTLTPQEFMNDPAPSVSAAQLDQVTLTLDAQETQLAGLTARINTLEQTLTSLISTDRMEEVAEKVENSVDMLSNLQALVGGIEAKAENTEEKLKAITPDKLLGDIPSRIASIEQKATDPEEARATVEAMEKFQKHLDELTTRLGTTEENLKKMNPDTLLGDISARIDSIEKMGKANEEEIKPLAEMVEKLQRETREDQSQDSQKEQAEVQDEAPSSAETKTAHRLFVYFEDSKDREKIESLVTETLKKDMTYAQVMNHVAKEMGNEKGQVITDHPSLAKDYIRLRRRDG